MSIASKAMLACKALTVPIYDMPRKLQQTIPIYQIAEDGIFLLEKKSKKENKRFDKAYLFTDCNYSMKNEMEKEQFLKIYCQFLNSLNVSFKITIMNNNRNMEKLRKEVFVQCSSSIYQELVKNINDNIQSGIKKGRNGIEQAKIFVITCESQNVEHARNFFRTIEGNLVSNFKRLGCTLIPLTAEVRLRYLHSFYRLGKEEEYRFDYRASLRKEADWRNDICNLAIRHYADNLGRYDGQTLQYDERYVRVLFAKEYPNSISDEFMKVLTSVSFHTITTLDVAPIPQEVGMKRLLDLYMENGKTIEKQQEQRNKARAYSSDIPYGTKKEKEEIENYLDIMTENDEKLFYMGLYVAVTAFSKEELETNVLSLTTEAANYSVQLEPAIWNQLEALNTTLPIGVRYCETMRPMFTQPLCGFTPFNVQELYDKGGIYYGINSVSQNIIVGDRKKLMNPHGFVLGVTGSGKGMDAKGEMSQVVVKGDDDVIVIDPQNEYKTIAKSLGGQFIDLSATSDNHINPLDMDTLHFYESQEKFIADKVELMLGIAEHALQGEITIGQKSLVGRCVKLMYEEYFHTGPKACPTMAEFNGILKMQKEEEARSLELGFELFIHGSLNYFAKPTNVNLKNRFIVYGLNDLGNNLAPIAQLIMMESIRSRIVSNFQKGVSTWLYIDEFHNLTKTRFTVEYLVKFWKEVRKLGALCTGMTQNIVDLLKTEEIQTMLCNSQFISLLNQGENELAILSEVLGLNEEYLEVLRGAETGCGVLRFGDKKYLPRDNKIPKGTLMYDLFNTDFHQKQKNRKKSLEKEFDKLPSVAQAEAMGKLEEGVKNQ